MRGNEKLLICGLSILVVFATVELISFIGDRWGHDAVIRWGGLIFFSLVLFALFMADSENLLRKRRFWGVATILLVGHIVVFTILLTHVGTWRLPWFMGMVVEYPLFHLFRERFVR
jgi:hypothetical protein